MSHLQVIGGGGGRGERGGGDARGERDRKQGNEEWEEEGEIVNKRMNLINVTHNASYAVVADVGSILTGVLTVKET